mgnify:FL=1
MFSKINNNLLHICFEKNLKEGLEDVILENNFLQIASISLNKDQIFKTYQHIWKDINYKKTIAKESGVI